MKIIVMDAANVRIEVLNVPDYLLEDDVETFLAENGFSLNNISWMAAPVDFVPVVFHDYGKVAMTGEDVHFTRNSKLKDFTICEQVQEVKNREQEELAGALRLHGENVDDGYEVHFEGDMPIIGGYLFDEPCDIVILSARVDEDGDLTLIGEDKQDRGHSMEVDVDEIFAGLLDFVTAEVRCKPLNHESK